MIYMGLIAFFFLEYVRPIAYYPGLTALHLNTIVPLLTGASSIVTAGSATTARVVRDPNFLMLLTMLGLILVSFFMADVQMLAWNTFTVELGFGLVTWIIANEVTTIGKFKGVIVALVGAHIAVAFYNPLLFTDPETRHYLTSGSFLGDGNDFSLSIVIVLPLCLFVLLETRRVVAKIVWAFVIVVLVAGVVVTQSRGGTVGLACMAAYFWAKSQKKAQTGFVMALVFALILALAPGNYFARMSMISDTTEGSASARLTAWGVAIRMAIDNPLLGVGVGNFGTKIGNEYRPAGFVGVGMNAHSIYFSALGEMGFPGLILLLSFIGWNLRENQRLALELKARGSPHHTELQLLSSLSAALIAFASAGAFLSALYYPHLYVVAGLLTAGRHVVRQKLDAASSAPSHAVVAPAASSIHWALRPLPRPSAPPTVIRPRLAPPLVGGARPRQ